MECCDKHDRVINCNNCNFEINIYTNKFLLCKKCSRIHHTHCLFQNICIECIPNFTSNANIHSTHNIHTHQTLSHDKDYSYNDLPVFSPFNSIDKTISNLPEPDEIYEQIQSNSQILQSCNYYDISNLHNITTTDKGSIIISWNVDGIRSNFDSIILLDRRLKTTNDNNINILGYVLCETNVTEFQSNPFYLNGYNKFVLDKIKISDSKFKHKGSGIMILLDISINNAEIDNDLCQCTPDSEFLVVKYKSQGSTVFITGVYRPPSGSVTKFMENFDNLMLNINKHKNNKCHLLGDFNFNLYNPSTNYVSSYLDCMFSNNLFPLISRATHFKGVNPTCIDHILTNSISDIVLSGIITCSISHHMPVFIVISNGSDDGSYNAPNNPRPIINEYTIAGFVKDFKSLSSQFNSADCHHDTPASEKFEYFLNDFALIYNKWFIQSRQNRNLRRNCIRKDWITVRLAKCCGVKNKLYSTWRKNKTHTNWSIYQTYKRTLDNHIAKAKFYFYTKEFASCQTDLKKTWKTINDILGRKRRNRLLIFNDANASHNFNKYFVSIAGNLINKNYSSCGPSNYSKYLGNGNPINIIDDCDFSSDDLTDFISKLNNNKSIYFSPKVLKIISRDISPTLTKLFNMCHNEGTFPQDLKLAKVIPIFKNRGDIKDISNYRPISMLSVFSKLFEKLIHKRLLDFFVKNNLFNPSQYGFRPGHSTQHALINATENVYNSLDMNFYTIGIFIDFSKAFDTISHDILLYKLKHYGIHGKMLNLIKSYISNRYQYVSYGNITSTQELVELGVPQGSVLGPLLFLIYINDLCNISDLAKFVLFADDSNLFLSHPNRYTLYSLANDILHKLFEFCSANKIVINLDKCCFMEFSSTKPNSDIENYNLRILNHSIDKVTDCKFLGICLTSTLDWKLHIKHVINQISKATGAINSIKSIVPAKILRNIYFSLVQPYLVYCAPLWASIHNTKEFNNLFIAQKKAIRIISNETRKINYRFTNTKPLFHKHNILTVHNLYYYLLSIEMYKILNNKSPPLIYDFFTISTRSVRLILPKYKHYKYANLSFCFTASKIANYLLQNDICYSGYTLLSYKTKLKRFLMHKQSLCLNNDLNWLPCNLNIYSDVNIN